MRVLHLLEATGGGTRRHVLDLLPALQKCGVEVALGFSPLRYPAFYDDARVLRARGIETFAIPMARGPSPQLDARALQHLTRVLKRDRPDLLHLHSFKAGLVGRVAARLARVPVVYTPHCVAFDTGLPASQRRVALMIERLLVPQTSRYIAVSRREEVALRRALHLAESRVAYVPNGVNARDFPSNPQSAIQNPQLIGCFGRLTAQKNQSLLLRALKILAHDGFDANLLLCGAGEDEARLRALAERLGVSARVSWTGEVSDARHYVERCDVVAVPSRWEGCPYAVLEAMAQERAVVGANVGGISELLSGGAGFLVSSRTARAWARALVDLLQNSQARQALGAAGRARVEAEFSLQQMTRETLAVYQSVYKPGG